jgi:hypothetical protein
MLLFVHGMTVFFFRWFDLWKLEDIRGSGRNPGYIETYIVPSQQSTYAKAFIYQS